MSVLILGLIIFLGMHSLGTLAPGWRQSMIERMGLMSWKGVFALASIIGLIIIIWGFGLARQHPVLLYAPPLWLRHLNSLLTLIAFLLVVAAYIPRNHIKARLGHPMLLGVKVWAFGHLLATGMLRDVVLFGAFLLWAIAAYAVSRRRDRRNGVSAPAGTLSGDALVIIAGIAVWFVFAMWLHGPLIGRYLFS